MLELLTSYARPLMGGALIGAGAALLLILNGRIAGISGITGRLIDPLVGAADASDDDGQGWRIAFVVGLAVAGVVARVLAPARIGMPARSLAIVVLAGLLVGFGTRLGNGCTSGHGVCGLSRGSPRSLVAVIVFMAVAMVTTGLTGLVQR